MLNIKAAFARQRSLARGADNGAQAEERKKKRASIAKKALINEIARGEKVFQHGKWLSKPKSRGAPVTMKPMAFGGAIYTSVAKEIFFWYGDNGVMETYFTTEMPLVKQTVTLFDIEAKKKISSLSFASPACLQSVHHHPPAVLLIHCQSHHYSAI